MRSRLAAVFASAVLAGTTLAAVFVPVVASADTVSTKVVAPGTPPFISPPHWVSQDGRYVLFNGAAGLTVADTVANTSVAIPGAGSNYGSLSDDGRFVVFLLGDGVATRAQLWDRTTATSEIVSLTDDDQPAAAEYYGPSVSGDGRFIAFLSSDPVLQPPGWDYGSMGSAIFLRDRVAGTTQPITTTPSASASGGFVAPSLSNDGGVAVWSGSLFPNTGDGGIVVWNRATNSLSQIAANPDCCSSDDQGPMVSGDGRYVVWSGYDPVASSEHVVWIHDLQTHLTTPLTTRYGSGASISDDGRYVSYSSKSADGLSTDVYRLDRQTATDTQLNFDAQGVRINGSNSITGISGDGARVAFSSDSTGQEQVVLATITAAGGGVILPTLDPPAPPKDAVWAWGWNGFGQLGQPASGAISTLAREVPSMPTATAVAGRANHSIALGSDRTVWAWGSNYYGELGNGTYSASSSAVQVAGLTNVTAIAAGAYHNLALRTDGTVWAWGANYYGQLGDGTVMQRPVPFQIPGLTNVQAIAAGEAFSLAVRTDGTVRAWGLNNTGQLGDGTTTNRLSPVAVAGLTAVSSVAGGAGHSLAVRTDGTVRAWGLNDAGQLGDGTTTNRLTPVSLSGLAGISAVAAGGSQSPGYGFSLALRSDGTVRAWGSNLLGQLGDGTTSTRLTAVPVPGLTTISAISAGDYDGVVLRTDGTLRAWGDNAFGELGDGTASTVRLTPITVAGLTNVTAIGTGGRAHTLAVGRASPNQGFKSFTTTVPAGGTVTTDVEQDGATPKDLIETTLTTPVAGSVSIVANPFDGSAGNFSLQGATVHITAPAATVAQPLVIRFRLDVFLFPTSWSVSLASVYRNGTPVADCTGPGAVPDPCVESRTRLQDNDVEIVVRTSHASEWLIGRTGPSAHAGGPYTIPEGSTVALHGSAADGLAPYTYRWLGAGSELSSSTVSAPKFSGVDDRTYVLTLLVTDAAGLTGIDTTTVTVVNRPPIVSPLVLTRNAQRRVEVAAVFLDPGRLDTHIALIQWGDGAGSSGVVREVSGIGTVTGSHVYARNGTYTVTVIVRDKDGGEGHQLRQVVVK